MRLMFQALVTQGKMMLVIGTGILGVRAGSHCAREDGALGFVHAESEVETRAKLTVKSGRTVDTCQRKSNERNWETVNQGRLPGGGKVRSGFYNKT